MLKGLWVILTATLILYGYGLPQIGEAKNVTPLQPEKESALESNMTSCNTPGSVTNVIVQGGVAGPKGERGVTGPPGQNGEVGPPGPPSGGVAYTRWGKTSCPSTAQEVYQGFMAGSAWSKAGSASYLCLHETPEFLNTSPGLQDYGRAIIYITEYEVRTSPPAFGNMYGHDAPCAVCYAPARNTQLTIPGRITCPSSWTLEYRGYLMADRSTDHQSGRVPVCIDEGAVSVPGSSHRFDQSQLYFIEVACQGATVCPPYSEGAEIACVVCTK